MQSSITFVVKLPYNAYRPCLICLKTNSTSSSFIDGNSSQMSSTASCKSVCVWNVRVALTWRVNRSSSASNSTLTCCFRALSALHSVTPWLYAVDGTTPCIVSRVLLSRPLKRCVSVELRTLSVAFLSDRVEIFPGICN